MISIGPSEVVFLGSLISIIGACWSIYCFARKTQGYGPLLVLTSGGLSIIGGNTYGYSDEPMTYLEVVVLMALALGFAFSLYTILATKRRGGGSSGH